MEIRVPDGVAARITTNATVAVTEVDTGRFREKGDGYESLDHASAKNRADITITVSGGREAVR